MDYNDKNYYEVLGYGKTTDFTIDDLNYLKTINFDDLKYMANKRLKETTNDYEREKIKDAYRKLSDKEEKKRYDSYLENFIKNRNIYSDSSYYHEPLSYKKGVDITNIKKNVKKIVNSTIYLVASTTGYVAEKIRKAKLYGSSQSSSIGEVKTSESELIKEFNLILENKIDVLLNNHTNNYDLKIAYLRYENQIELLKQLIAIRENSNPLSFETAIYSLRLSALHTQLERAQTELVKIQDKLENYDKEDKLFKIYKKISDTESSIENLSDKEHTVYNISKLKIYQNRLSKLLSKREKQVRKVKLFKNNKYALRDKVIKIYDITKNFGSNILNPPIDYIKTR